MRSLSHLILMLALGLLAACGPAPFLFSEDTGPRTSEFQKRLDGLDIPLALPAAGKAILVNVPAFELIAFEDATPVLSSRIIVGTAENRTPLIDTAVSRVTFRPSWRPTPAMVASGEYPDRVRPPGPNNPLGLAAIRLEPGLLVYLHDTNQRHLFARDFRALSHGCIRVERWDELIAWILDRDIAWVRAMAERSPSKEVSAPPVPVMIRYLTRFPDDNGSVRVFRDVYALGGNAARVEKAMPISCVPG